VLDARAVILLPLADVGWSPPQCCTVVPVKALARHKLSAAAYRTMRDAQDGVCVLCGESAWLLDQAVPLVIDHDHVCCPTKGSCGRCVRGLLCAGCNGTLGEMELFESEGYGGEWRGAARAYLRRAGCDPDAPYRRDWFRREAARRKAALRAEPR
jgi:hypothetical protein